MAGTLAGLQLLSVRRGPGRVTAVRIRPKPPEHRTQSQIDQEARFQNLAELYRLWTQSGIHLIRDAPGCAEGFYNAWCAAILASVTQNIPDLVFPYYAPIAPNVGTLPPTQVAGQTIATATHRLTWSAYPPPPGSSPTDRLTALVIRIPFTGPPAAYVTVDTITRAAGSTGVWYATRPCRFAFWTTFVPATSAPRPIETIASGFYAHI